MTISLEDYIRQEWPQHADRVIELYRESFRDCSTDYVDHRLAKRSDYTPGVFSTLFVWADTPEGYDFWRAVYKSALSQAKAKG